MAEVVFSGVAVYAREYPDEVAARRVFERVHEVGERENAASCWLFCNPEKTRWFVAIADEKMTLLDEVDWESGAPFRLTRDQAASFVRRRHAAISGQVPGTVRVKENGGLEIRDTLDPGSPLEIRDDGTWIVS